MNNSKDVGIFEDATHVEITTHRFIFHISRLYASDH